jgi:hypothetical protein
MCINRDIGSTCEDFDSSPHTKHRIKLIMEKIMIGMKIKIVLSYASEVLMHVRHAR